MLVNYSIQKVIAIDDENNIIGYSDSGLGIGDITYIEKNGFCDNQISPHFVSETFIIAKPVFNLSIS